LKKHGQLRRYEGLQLRATYSIESARKALSHTPKVKLVDGLQQCAPWLGHADLVGSMQFEASWMKNHNPDRKLPVSSGIYKIIGANLGGINGYVLLHGINIGVYLTFTFGQVYVFIRVLGVDEYANVIVASVIAIYTSSVDSAFSKLIYSTASRNAEREFLGVWALVYLYLGAAVLCMLGFGIGVHVFGNRAALDFFLFLLVSVLGNIWAYELQALCVARNCYFEFEYLELTRRIVQLMLLLALLKGLHFTLYLSLSNLFLVVNFLVFFVILRRRSVSFVTPSILVQVLGDKPLKKLVSRNFLAALLATLGESLLTNMSYFFVPVVFGVGYPLVIFDTAQKLVRAAQSGCKIFIEGLLPKWLLEFRRSERRAVLKTSYLIFGLCGGVAALAIGSIQFADGAVLKFLLGDQVEISSSLIVAMMCIIASSFPYFVSIALLSYAGDFAGIIIAASSGATLLLAEIAAVYLGGLDMIDFLYGFVFALILASSVSTWRLARRLYAIAQVSSCSEVQSEQAAT
jgi:hypothetical protein